MGVMNHKNKIVEYNIDSGIRHTELILPTIKKALRRLSLPLKRIDYFVVGLGPGSFTGLRIGLATIKGFAMALKKSVIALPTLDVLASNALPTNSKVICPLIDAKRNLVFTALYESGFNDKSHTFDTFKKTIISETPTFSKLQDEYPKVRDKLKRRSPYLLINIEELLSRLRSTHKLVTFLGDGLRLYQHKLSQKMKNSIFLDEDTWYPQAENLIKLALDSIDKGRFSDAKKVKPIYLYPKECQIKIQN